MALHFVQTAIALLAAGASILIIAGFVRETLRDQGRGIHLFPEAHERPETSAAKPDQPAVTNDAGPFPHSRGELARDRKRARSRSGKTRELTAGQRREQRRSRKRDQAKPEAGARDPTAETEDL